MYLLLLISGFIVLTLSGNYLVKGAVSIAKFYKISTLVIGATVVSMGTSAPELLVSVGAALKGKPDMSLGNVIGSNLSNIALVLGLTALILPIPVKKGSIRKDWSVMIFSSTVFILFMVTGNEINFWEGLVMFAGLVCYVVWSIKQGRKDSIEDNSTESTKPPIGFSFVDIRMIFTSSSKDVPLSLGIVLVVISSVGLVYGASLLVEGASGIARSLGVSERVIAVSVIALGTSLPELATSIMAAIKKEMDISIGNIIGSNIFNLLGILGITGMIRPVHLNDRGLIYDSLWMLAVSILLMVLIIPYEKKITLKNRISALTYFVRNKCKSNGEINRWEGLFLSLIYLAYIIILFAL